MHNDDRQTGRILSRREALALLGAAGAAMLAGRTSWSSAADPALACVASPEQTEGPYFVDERLNRSDIRSDPADGSVREGLPLTLRLAISSVVGGKCAPLAGATVDLWHCDAAGVYSDASDPGFNTKGKKFLRGYQVTDAGGGVHLHHDLPRLVRRPHGPHPLQGARVRCSEARLRVYVATVFRRRFLRPRLRPRSVRAKGTAHGAQRRRRHFPRRRQPHDPAGS